MTILGCDAPARWQVRPTACPIARFGMAAGLPRPGGLALTGVAYLAGASVPSPRLMTVPVSATIAGSPRTSSVSSNRATPTVRASDAPRASQSTVPVTTQRSDLHLALNVSLRTA